MSMKETIRVFKDIDSLCAQFTDMLIRQIRVKQGQFNIALSGGSTPIAMFSYWKAHFIDMPEWQQVQWFWGDERCVHPDDDQSNYRNARMHLLEPLGIPAHNIYRIRGEDDPGKEAKRYGQLLNESLPRYNDYPVFDLIMLGMGADGHTASIFPHEIHLWHNPANCVTATHPDTGQRRVSLTGNVINAAQEVSMLVTGKPKSERLSEILNDRKSSGKNFPAALVHPQKGNLSWFLDEEAASLMPNE